MRQSVLRPSRVFITRLRNFSTETASKHAPVIFVGRHPEVRQNPLLGQSASFPLPGDVTNSSLQKGTNPARVETAPSQPLPSYSITELTSAPSVGYSQREAQEIYFQEQPPSDLAVELTAQECPKLMQKDLDRLFPGLGMQSATVTVLNLAQQTKFDQKGWTPEMETERDNLTASFISAATSICTTLQRCGHWADFVDPSSGRPYLGRFTNSSLFETDDAYRKMGFRIEDLGCCKVLQHATWGSRAFVGTIFTDAPMDSQIVQDMIAKLREE